ncbi:MULTISPECIES: recombinase family protein [unclassified Corynebacterium]|uniref:recombinase family protein n=1 Tax=unclassified Corynebacterium TaxID=2624378 RepID=UPI0008A2FE28|nr:MULTISPECIES: recombinase family protein [unclassified Corynebacterium]OFL11752.1 hypothetical protein HMPREF2788_01460 [Corynebacterium sp. HMSC063F04]OHR38740.1 hypothetical protein HMPREF2920_02845 [Corynebacterium sp. HMSC075F02]
MTTRAAIYLRISLDAAMDGLAIDRQRQDCEALAEQRGWDVVHTYVDQSISASKKDVDRPDYDAMVASFERGEIDAIICWDLAGQSDRSDRITPAPQRNQGCTLKTFGGGGNSPSLPRDKIRQWRLYDAPKVGQIPIQRGLALLRCGCLLSHRIGPCEINWIR